AAISALSALIFARLAPDAGAEMADRLPTPAEPSDQRAGCDAAAVAQRNPVANRYNSAESVRLAGGLTCLTVLSSRLSEASSAAAVPPCSTFARNVPPGANTSRANSAAASTNAMILR